MQNGPGPIDAVKSLGQQGVSSARPEGQQQDPSGTSFSQLMQQLFGPSLSQTSKAQKNPALKELDSAGPQDKAEAFGQSKELSSLLRSAEGAALSSIAIPVALQKSADDGDLPKLEGRKNNHLEILKKIKETKGQLRQTGEAKLEVNVKGRELLLNPKIQKLLAEVKSGETPQGIRPSESESFLKTPNPSDSTANLQKMGIDLEQRKKLQQMKSQLDQNNQKIELRKKGPLKGSLASVLRSESSAKNIFAEESALLSEQKMVGAEQKSAKRSDESVNTFKGEHGIVSANRPKTGELQHVLQVGKTAELPQRGQELLKKIEAIIMSQGVKASQSTEFSVSHQDLGPVRIRMEQLGQSLALAFETQDGDARDAILQGKETLLEGLKRSGLKVGEFRVDHSWSSSQSQFSTSNNGQSQEFFSQSRSGGQRFYQGSGQGQAGNGPFQQGQERRDELWEKARERRSS